MIDESNNNITFADVAGCEEAKMKFRAGRFPARSLPSSRSSAAASRRAC